MLNFENFTYQRQNLKVNRIQTYKFYNNDSVTRITMQLKLHMLFFLFNISTNQPHERAHLKSPCKIKSLYLLCSKLYKEVHVQGSKEDGGVFVLRVQDQLSETLVHDWVEEGQVMPANLTAQDVLQDVAIQE